MKVKNIRTGKEFETNIVEWQQAIVEKGNAHLYKVIEDDAPIEVKNLKIELSKKKVNNEPKTK